MMLSGVSPPSTPCTMTASIGGRCTTREARTSCALLALHLRAHCSPAESRRTWRSSLAAIRSGRVRPFGVRRARARPLPRVGRPRLAQICEARAEYPDGPSSQSQENGATAPDASTKILMASSCDSSDLISCCTSAVPTVRWDAPVIRCPMPKRFDASPQSITCARGSSVASKASPAREASNEEVATFTSSSRAMPCATMARGEDERG